MSVINWNELPKSEVFRKLCLIDKLKIRQKSTPLFYGSFEKAVFNWIVRKADQNQHRCSIKFNRSRKLVSVLVPYGLRFWRPYVVKVILRLMFSRLKCNWNQPSQCVYEQQVRLQQKLTLLVTLATYIFALLLWHFILNQLCLEMCVEILFKSPFRS